jgi:glycosyltransferase involved in cell wall biosynthesis
MSSYNHAQFVGHSIESVIDQTFQDFEFLIGDDASTDETPDVVARYSDPRVAFTRHERNRGAYAVVNELLARCRGEYIAHLNSDDFWPLDKLAYQVQFLDGHPEFGAHFGDALFVDATDSVRSRPSVDGYNFNQPNRTRGAWLRQFFEFGPCLCHPTVLIRRSCFDVLGGYDNRLRQTPDFDLWVRFIKRYAVYISERPLVHFRWISGGNTSAPNVANLTRVFAENLLIGNRFFDGATRELLSEGFSDLFVSRELPSAFHVDIEKALLFFRPVRAVGQAYRVVGLQKLEWLLGSRPHREVLVRDYGFDESAFHRLLPAVDVFYAAAKSGIPPPGIRARLPQPGSGLLSTRN